MVAVFYGQTWTHDLPYSLIITKPLPHSHDVLRHNRQPCVSCWIAGSPPNSLINDIYGMSWHLESGAPRRKHNPSAVFLHGLPSAKKIKALPLCHLKGGCETHGPHMASRDSNICHLLQDFAKEAEDTSVILVGWQGLHLHQFFLVCETQLCCLNFIWHLGAWGRWLSDQEASMRPGKYRSGCHLLESSAARPNRHTSTWRPRAPRDIFQQTVQRKNTICSIGASCNHFDSMGGCSSPCS